MSTNQMKGSSLEKGRRSIRRKGHAATIGEVAALAKVSPMTVSRVMNGNASVREATRERVLRAVDKLGYTPNLAASTLATAQSTRVALIYNDPSGAYLSDLLVGVLHGAVRSAVQLVIDSWDELDADGERQAARALARSVAGVILPPPLGESKAVVSELVRAGIPVVAIAAERFREDISCVHIDDFRAASEMTQYLIALGHTRIGFIKGDPNQVASQRRFEGYHAALEAAGIGFDRALVQQGYYTYRSALEPAEKLLARRQRPSAIFASNDDMAAATISVAHRRGLEVPADLTVVGFDDTSTATRIWPELTTVRQPLGAMADAALDHLLRSIRNKDREPVLIDQVVQHVLVKRGSVAAPGTRQRSGS